MEIERRNPKVPLVCRSNRTPRNIVFVYDVIILRNVVELNLALGAKY